MSEIDLDAMVEKNIKTARKGKKPMVKFHPPKVSQSNKVSQFLKKELNEDSKFIGEVPNEISRFSAPMIIKGLSYPARDRKQLLEYKLNNSEYTNKYLKKYICVDKVAGLNDHLKFGLVYAVNLAESMLVDLSRLNKPAEPTTSKMPENLEDNKI